MPFFMEKRVVSLLVGKALDFLLSSWNFLLERLLTILLISCIILLDL